MVDNAKCLIDVPRTKDTSAIVNSKFSEFAKDFGFEVSSCMPYHACTKGKVEKTMSKVAIMKYTCRNGIGFLFHVSQFKEVYKKYVAKFTFTLYFKLLNIYLTFITNIE